MSSLMEEFASKSVAEQLVAKARAIAPTIAARVDEIHRIRDLPQDICDEMRAAGLFRLYQPAEWGGFECDPRVYFDVQGALAEQCLSTAWVQGVLAVQPLLMALFPHQAQADVWGKDPTTVLSSAHMPPGKVIEVEGGYRLSGRWHFSSGCSLAGWVTVGGMVPVPEQPPEFRLFIVPRSDWRIDDMWHSFGLRGTASNDIVVDNAFVPAHRSYVPTMGLQNFTRAERPRSPLYRLPWLPLFAFSTSNLAVGAGRAALRTFIGITRTKVGGLTGKAIREDPVVVELCARLSSETDLIDVANRRSIQTMLDYVAADRVIPLDVALRLRYQSASALRRITAIVEDMTLFAGAKGVLENVPLTRIWLDLCAARLHPGNDPAGAAALLGTALMEAP
jgi:3-hydroxy-9,10-secoandrosta-1,3,5(10)-triene-9,17-dione monooxygenase